MNYVQKFYNSDRGSVYLEGNQIATYSIVVNFPKNWKMAPVIIKGIKTKKTALTRYDEQVLKLQGNSFNSRKEKKLKHVNII